jgi:hypothetical protein
MSDRMPEDIPGRMSENIPDRIINRISKDISNRMPINKFHGGNYTK